MRLAFLLAITTGLIGCASGTNSNSSYVAPIPSTNQSSAIDAQKKAELVQIREEAINEISAELNAPNLRTSPPLAGRELRVIVGFGVIFPRCFIFTKTDGKSEAFFIDPKVVGNKAVLDKKGQVQPSKTALAPPTSGWDEFEQSLAERGVGEVINLKMDEKFYGDPDMESIMIETQGPSGYSMSFFSLGTPSDDGKKAWQVCKLIEQEFHVRVGCGATRSVSQMSSGQWQPKRENR